MGEDVGWEDKAGEDGEDRGGVVGVEVEETV